MGGAVFSVGSPSPGVSAPSPCHLFHHAQGNHQHTGTPLKGILVQSTFLILTRLCLRAHRLARYVPNVLSRQRDGEVQRILFVIQAGNQVGENFWKMVLAEHGLDNNGVRVSPTPVPLPSRTRS